MEGASLAGDSEDDIDWEEIDVLQQNIEITLQASPRKDAIDSKKKGLSHAERLTRIDCHKIHTVCLLANASVRNRWINDPLLHARLLSITPLSLQNALAMIHKSRVPDQNKRGRLFETAIAHLVQWWSGAYFEVDFAGHIRNKTFDEVQSQIAGLSLEAILDLLEEQDSEVIRSPNSLMKHTLMRSGSRDTSAQLFTALCRALGIPARLVVSLQSVPWQASVGKSKSTPKASGKRNRGVSTGKGKGREQVLDDVEADDRSGSAMEESRIPSSSGQGDVKGKAKEGSFPGEGQNLRGTLNVKIDGNEGKEKAKPVIKLRKTKNKGQKLGASSPSRTQASPDPLNTPPVFWTEVFSRPDSRWLPIDPIRSIVNKRKAFDPSSESMLGVKQDNRMAYVMAFEEDGYARDVTPRYAKEYAAKVAKAQGAGARVGGGRKEWWERVVSTVRRPYRLLRDDLEDEELQENQLREGMPTSMTGFKDHPLYVLSRHLRRDEVIHPLVELGKFRGEPVYSRSSVFSLKTAENWMRSGRKVKEGSQPMKWVKQRAATVNKQREIEVAMEMGRSGGEGIGQGAESSVMQGLYAKNQTELYKPGPVVNGKIPKNDFGNIDLYVPSMLPDGGAHVPFKGAAKIARQLGFDYAEAVTGFEFKKRRAFPVVQGVVVASENEAALLEAYWEAEEQAEEKARMKRQDRVIKQWSRLVQGLRLRKRLQEQYGADAERQGVGTVDEDKYGPPEVVHDKQGGGFLLVADDVVEPHHLPRYQHVIPPPPSTSHAEPVKCGDEQVAFEDVMDFPLETMDDDQDQDIEDVPSSHQPLQTNGVPKTMQQMAEDAIRHQLRNSSRGPPVDGEYQLAAKTVIPQTRTTRSSRTAIRSNSISGKVVPRPRPDRKRLRDEGSGPVSDSEGSRSLPVKRARNPTTTPAPTGRLLRPRPPKNAAKIQEEIEQEVAFRRAVADF